MIQQRWAAKVLYMCLAQAFFCKVLWFDGVMTTSQLRWRNESDTLRFRVLPAPHHFWTTLRDLMACPVPFFVWFHHRSGSSHLCSLLDSHSSVACWGEFFFRGEADAKQDLFSRSGKATEADFLEDFYGYRWNKQGAYLCVEDPEPPLVQGVGFKLKYQQADKHPEAMKYLKSQDKMKAIHLVRTNLLSALISAAMIPRLIKKYRRPNLLSGDRPEDVQRTVRLDPSTVLQELEELEQRIERARQSLGDLDTLEITYEDLVRAEASTCQKVLKFLGIPPDDDLSSRYVKVMPNSASDSLENVHEIAEALQGTRFETFLDASGVR